MSAPIPTRPAAVSEHEISTYAAANAMAYANAAATFSPARPNRHCHAARNKRRARRARRMGKLLRATRYEHIAPHILNTARTHGTT